MLQVFSNNLSTIVLDSAPPHENIEKVNERIKLCNCKNMTIDITNLNIMDACMVSTMCSTEHYLKYPDGNISWIVNSEKVEQYTKSMNLGNSIFSVRSR